MVQVKDLTELVVRDLWRKVKEGVEWWGELKQENLRIVQRLSGGAMEGEFLEQLRAGRYRRTELWRGYHNGYRHRSLLTGLGMPGHLRVPRDRDGHCQPTVLRRYQRRQEEVNQLVREMFLCGVSRRKIQAVVEPLMGVTLSAQTVSWITRNLDAEVQRYHARPLEDRYLYLLRDGITLKVKGAAGVKIPKIDKDEMVATLILNCPERLNAIIMPMHTD